jgi:hypothetical protein
LSALSNLRSRETLMHKPLSLTVGALAAAGALAATLPAAEAQPPGKPAQCFFLNQVANSRLIGLRTLYLRLYNKNYYRMDFAGDCNDMGTEPLILHPFDNNGQVCSALELDVRVRATGQVCNPASLKLLTPDEVSAIPAKDRP